MTHMPCPNLQPQRTLNYQDMHVAPTCCCARQIIDKLRHRSSVLAAGHSRRERARKGAVQLLRERLDGILLRGECCRQLAP